MNAANEGAGTTRGVLRLPYIDVDIVYEENRIVLYDDASSGADSCRSNYSLGPFTDNEPVRIERPRCAGTAAAASLAEVIIVLDGALLREWQASPTC